MTLPNFLIIGAPKAGTTALYHYLKEHPQIYMSPVKEPKFFALEGKQIDFRGPGDLKKDYVTDIEAYSALFNNVSQEVAIGEASPGYLHSTEAPERIRHYIPDAKLIVIIRDPVERAYSHFLSLVRQDLEPLTDFMQAMEAEEERILNKWSPRWLYKQRGFYYDQLKRYFDLFDRNQIRVYIHKDFKNNSVGVLQDIFQFLDVDDTFVPDTSQKHNATYTHKNKALHKLLKEQNLIKSILKPILSSTLSQSLKTNIRNLNTGKRPQLQAKIRKQFIEEYREDILKLQELIQRDLSGWLKG